MSRFRQIRARKAFTNQHFNNVPLLYGQVPLSPPWISVAICTWNRALRLDQTLERLRSLDVPADVAWELVVVDNNSSDHTAEVIAKHQPHLPLIALRELKPGHSHARNCAIEHARGEFIVWTDDDVLVDPGWLREYAAAFRRWPTVGFYGGTVTPWFESEPPAWLAQNWDRFQTFFAVRELGTQTRPFERHETPFGANMAFSLATLRQYQFDPNRGHVGTMARGGDETDVFDRMRRDGLRGMWIGSAKLEHLIPNERMSKRFLWDYARRIARQQPPREDDTARWFGAPRWLVGEYLRCRATCALRSRAHDARWAELFLRTAAIRGQIDEYRTKPALRSGGHPSDNSYSGSNT